VAVQDIHGSQITINSNSNASSNSLASPSEFTDTIQMQAYALETQASVIAQLIQQRDQLPIYMKYPSPAAKGGETSRLPIDGHTWGDQFLLSANTSARG
jgi:hypothetical protein